MTYRPFRFTTDGELFDALFDGIPPAELPARKKRLAVLGVCIVALLIGGVGAVRAVQNDDVAGTRVGLAAMEAPAAS